jgi:hypothetical protein
VLLLLLLLFLATPFKKLYHSGFLDKPLHKRMGQKNGTPLKEKCDMSHMIRLFLFWFLKSLAFRQTVSLPFLVNFAEKGLRQSEMSSHV